MESRCLPPFNKPLELPVSYFWVDENIGVDGSVLCCEGGGEQRGLSNRRQRIRCVFRKVLCDILRSLIQLVRRLPGLRLLALQYASSSMNGHLFPAKDLWKRYPSLITGLGIWWIRVLHLLGTRIWACLNNPLCGGGGNILRCRRPCLPGGSRR